MFTMPRHAAVLQEHFQKQAQYLRTFLIRTVASCARLDIMVRQMAPTPATPAPDRVQLAQSPRPTACPRAPVREHACFLRVALAAVGTVAVLGLLTTCWCCNRRCLCRSVCSPVRDAVLLCVELNSPARLLYAPLCTHVQPVVQTRTPSTETRAQAACMDDQLRAHRVRAA
jgi:hypothetical protein